MAAVFVNEDLSCYICLNPYTDPVSLQCGHRFCRDCIAHELDTQGGSRVYTCPNCGEEFLECPPILHKKRRLHTVETVPCTYCDGPVPAEKTCLHCDASLCAKHLTKHSTAPEHVLIEPTASSEDRKCPVHWQVLDHYCTEHNVFICSPCYLGGEHWNHEVLLLNIHSVENENKNLNLFIENLRKERQKIQAQIDSLQDSEEAQEKKIDAVSEQVTAQIQNVQRELEVLHNKVLNEVQVQKIKSSELVLDWKKKLEEQRQELTGKICDMQELCNVSDPLTFLKKVMGTDLIGIFDDENSKVSGNQFDEAPISEMLYKELLQFSDGLNKRMLKDAFPKMKKSEITLDIKTAHCKIKIRNSRTASYTANRQVRRACPERFRSQHVLSKCKFLSGNHYWEVEVRGTQCSIGVAYDNIERKTARIDSRIGYNRRSWALGIDDNLSVRHNNAKTKIPTDSPVRSFGIFLEYEAGRLSFYQLCDPIRHLHTFTTTFTRPLHAAFYLGEGSRITILN
ncbi:E3 ubiquitin-protein ligase TRIM11-like [Aquarana catesbeiana]|uniref:E3 ubiquitin-protein ligase TRIM11-like n=1 Tax=Aquarana catesbeiana TaxID=8400 RepID=UPI003CC931EF